MDQNRLSRRRFIAGAGAAIGTAVTASGVTVARGASKTSSKRTTPFSYCFNTSTIRGQKLSLDREIEITAKAGYGAIEPWVSKIHEYVRGGGSLSDLRRRISDLGLTVDAQLLHHLLLECYCQQHRRELHGNHVVFHDRTRPCLPTGRSDKPDANGRDEQPLADNNCLVVIIE